MSEYELTHKVYKHEIQEAHLLLAKYQKAIKDKDAILHDNKAINLCLKGNVLDKYEKLKKAFNHVMEESARTTKVKRSLKTLKKKLRRPRP